MAFIPAQGRSKAADFGTLLGKGVGSGINEQITNNLHQLAQHKMQNMQRKQQAGAWASLLGISPDKAYELTALPYETQMSLLENPSVLARLRGQQGNQNQNPAQAFNAQQPSPNQGQYPSQMSETALASPQGVEGLQNYFKMMGGQEPSQAGLSSFQSPLNQSGMPQQPNAMGQQPNGQPQDIEPEQLNLRTRPTTALQQEQLTALREKRAREEETHKNKQSEHIVELKTKRATLQDFVDTAKRARQSLASGKVSSGNPIYAGLTSNQYTSGLAPQGTESFATDASHLYNLKTEGLKGIMSATRLKNLFADKPGVGRSKNENMKIVDNYISQGSQALADFDKEYPEAMESSSPQQASSSERSTDTYEGPIRGTAEKPELWDPELKMYRPAKKRA